MDVSALKTDILEALLRKRPVSFNEEVMEKACESVAGALRTVINDVQLEELVMMLAQSSGARVEHAPKNSPLPGDVDVVATYDLRIGSEESTIQVGYQVKQNEGTSEIHGIQQLVDRMSAVPEPTAQEISNEAQQLADDNGIIVIRQKPLVEWILTSGLGVLENKMK